MAGRVRQFFGVGQVLRRIVHADERHALRSTAAKKKWNSNAMSGSGYQNPKNQRLKMTLLAAGQIFPAAPIFWLD